jgi:hypothetical protein
MAKKVKEIYSLINFTIDEISDFYDIHELELLIYVEPDIQEVDLMLEALEDYLVEKQEFEKCVIIRDERIRRENRVRYKNKKTTR